MKRLLCSLYLLCAAGASVAEAPQAWRDSLTGMTFIRVGSGCYSMGTSAALRHNPRIDLVLRLGFKGDLAVDEKPPHEVCVDAFWLGRHEVRVSEWNAVMGEPLDAEKGGMAKAGISWHAAQAFAERMSKRLGVELRLPSEAEWEYACRAGQHVELEDEAKIDGSMTERMASKARQSTNPNAWGLHDMLGGVWEWVADAYQPDAYSRHMLFNPLERTGATRVIRGGSHLSEPMQLRCGNRADYAPTGDLPQIGFRLLLTRLPNKQPGGR